MSERDTHFRGFGKLLWDDIDDLISELCIERADRSHPVVQQTVQKIQQRFTERGYDLVEHACLYIIETMTDDWELDEMVSEIPDIAKWPEER